MKRQTVLVSAAILILAVVFAYCGGKDNKSKVWVGNKISASYQPGVISEPASETTPDAEIFIDASGSMKPYFRADGTSMINTISEILNLNQKGTQIYFLGNPQPYKGLVKDIIGEVHKQPSLSATMFHDCFEKMACKLDTADNTLIYLVTDGIMSVGNGNTSKALLQLEGKITASLKEHPNLAGAVLRYVGEYKGDYWNSKNQRLTSQNCPILKEEIRRPYYVVVLGQKKSLRWLRSKVKDLNNPEEYFMGIHDFAGHAKATLALGDSTKIENVNDTLTLILELPECLTDIDSKQIKVVNEGTQLPVPVSKEGQQLIVKVPPTIGLRASAHGSVKLSFIAPNEVPDDWTSTWNSDDDIAGPDNSTTYGLKYLINGMFKGLEGDDDIMLKADFIYLPN